MDKKNDIFIKFWGTRGSIAKPGAETVRYGGNTSCVELISPKGTRIVIDCGTGGFILGQHLVNKKDYLRGNMLVSHTHWDHIQGIPFFTPFFMQGARWDVYGPKGIDKSIKETLSGQMQFPYFPVSLEQVNAEITYHDIVEGEFQIGDVKITSEYLNHTEVACGYRLEIDGIVIVYSCDHEPFSKELATGHAEITGNDLKHAKFMMNADLVIHDAQYTAKEYPSKIGWGHSTIDYAVRMCEFAKVKQLALTHHDPLREDKELDELLPKVAAELRKKGSKLKVFAAFEGQEIFLKPTKKSDNTVIKNSADVSNIPLSKQRVLLYVNDEKTKELLIEVFEVDNIGFESINNVKDLQRYASAIPDIIFLEHNPPNIDGIKLAEKIRATIGKDQEQPSIILIADKEETSPSVTNWLIKPFTHTYLRSKIEAYILRRACRWARPSVPPDETKRLAALYKLNILDTEHEERFNRITRIAAALFNIPIVLITLIDKDRQWFKAAYGINLREGPRDSSMCAHVVYQKDNMIIPDTSQDDRFADNPFVISSPGVRFYAGCPLILSDGECVGTLCLIDTRPRFFQYKEIKLLEDLRDMVTGQLQMTHD